MSLVFSSICPHPPLLIPTIGGLELEKISNTVKALEDLNKDFVQAKPKTVVVISPHAPSLPRAFGITKPKMLSGNFGAFGDFGTELRFESDQKLIKDILGEAKAEKISVQALDYSDLDHGTLVPLYYLTKRAPKLKLVVISFTQLDLKTHFQFGKLLAKVIKQADERIAVIASGDLSHRLTFDAPAGYSPRGKEFDEKLIELLKKKDVEGILNLDPELIEEVGECGLRSIIILLGILDKLDYKNLLRRTLKYSLRSYYKPEILSYEGPFGVGYLVVEFKLKSKQGSP